MIKSLEIHNFLSLVNVLINLHPGVNVFVGSTDVGKSAILRGLKLAIWNRPLGESFLSWPHVRDGEGLFVKIITDDHTIIRSKDKIEKYELDKTSFTAFNKDVPEEIIRALNITKINWQGQFDPPFLLSLSPGEVASHFNKVARLDKIDTSLQNIQSWIRQLTSDIKYKEGQVEHDTEALKQFEHLEKFEIDVEVLEGMDKKLFNLRSNHTKLCLIYNSYLTNAEQILCFQDDLKIEKPLNQIFEWKYEIEDIGTEGSELNFLVKQIKDVQTEILEQEELITLEKPVNALLELYENKETADDQRKRLFRAVSQLNGTNGQLETAEVRHKTLQVEFDRVFPNICPLCGKPK